MSDRILIIEDDRRLADMVASYLGEAGFVTMVSRTGGGGIALHDREPFDVLVLDLMLPDMDGLDVCRRLREKSQTPILMLTARGDAMDRVVGLEMGADDYLPKPGARQVRLDGEDRVLTSYQFDLLMALAEHAGRVLSRDALMNLMKNETLEAFDRSIDVHISRIRAAIEDDPKKPKRVITARGAGYVFAKAQD
jgi:two-component system, OmpR family, phosphate regulon response regulator OmpR